LKFGSQYVWNSVPADGHSGGILLDFNDDASWKSGAFFLSTPVFQRSNRLRWSFFLVYGPADHRRTDKFLGELIQAVNASPYPMVVGVIST
jgi:hypothetical protein